MVSLLNLYAPCWLEAHVLIRDRRQKHSPVVHGYATISLLSGFWHVHTHVPGVLSKLPGQAMWNLASLTTKQWGQPYISQFL